MSQAKASKKDASIFYTYIYLDITKPGYYRYGHWVFHFEPFYVGKGNEDRYLHHLNNVINKTAGRSHKSNRIRKIIRESGENPVIRIVRKNLLEQDAFDLEMVLIAKIGRRNLKTGPLTNLTDGGDGPVGQVFSSKSKKKMSKSAKAARANRTPEEVSRISKKAAITRSNRSQEDKDLESEKRRIKLENKTKRQKKATAKKRSESLKIAYAKKTPRQRKILNKKLSASAKIERASRGPEARKEVAAKMVETRMSKPKKVKEGIKTKFKKSRWGKPEKELNKITAKMSASLRNRTPDQKAATEEKRQATIARHLAEDPDFYIKIKAKRQHTIDSKSDEEKELLRIRQSENQKKVWKKLSQNQIQEITTKCYQTKKDLGYF